MLDYDSAANEVSAKQIYAHAAQILDLAPSPFAKDLVVTCGKPVGQGMAATLWRMEDLNGEEGSGGERSPKPLVALAELPQQKLPVSKYV